MSELNNETKAAYSVADFLSDYEIAFSERPNKTCREFVLDVCPICGKHNNVSVFAFRSGGISYRCLGCSGTIIDLVKCIVRDSMQLKKYLQGED